MKKIKIIISSIVLFFISRYVVINIEVLQSLLQVKSYYFLFLSFFILTLAFLIQVKIWKKVFLLNKIYLSFYQSLQIYSTAVMTAYIPGKLPGLYLTSKYANNLIKKDKNIFLSIIFYQLSSLFSAAIVGSIYFVLILNVKFYIIKILIIFTLIITIILFVNPYNYIFLQKIIKKIFKRDIRYKIQTTFSKNIYIISQLSFVWALISLSISLLNSSIKGYWDIDEYLIFSVVFLFSQILGAIIFILPSGIGVFESAIFFGVKTFISIEDSIRLAAISRLFMIVPAFLVFINELLLSLIRRKKISKKQ